MHSRTNRTDRQLAMLPRWAQDVAMTEALDAAKRCVAEDETDSPFPFQSALENTLDMVFGDVYVFARVGKECTMMTGAEWTRIFPDAGSVSLGTIVCERAR